MSRVDNLRFPQPLKADFTHPNPNIVSAYRICYLAEHVIKPTQDPLTPRQETVGLPILVNVRILGHLLSQSPFLSDAAISEVARGIISCRADPEGTGETDVEALNKLGELYKNHLLLPFRKFRAQGQTPLSTPSTSSDASSDSVEHTCQPQAALGEMLAQTPNSRTTSKKLAMQREDHRCIVTGMLGLQYAVDLRRRTGETYKDAVTCLHVCHIFAGSTIMNIGRGKMNEGDGDGEDNRWALLKSLGYTDIANDFTTADHVHSLTNVMMMAFNLRDAFDRLNMWFEPIENEYSCYRLCSIWMLPYSLVAGQEVTFQSTDSHRLPLPNREYLRIHAACCRVAQLSGAAIIFDELEQDMDSDPDP